MSDQIYHIVTVDCAGSASEDAVALLSDLGCTGMLEEDLDCGRRTRLRASFPDACGPELLANIRTSFSAFPDLADAAVGLTVEEAADWSERWKQHFAPFELVPGVIVTPSWERPPPPEHASVIHLDPGMAFGTGLHETTRLCARGLYDLTQQRGAKPSSLLDVGTGSGLIAILARRLGIAHIVAIDNDPEALRVASENFGKNDCPDIPLLGNIVDDHGRYDIVIANILLSPLLDLRAALSERTAAGGSLLLSGITHDQEQELARAFLQDFKEQEVMRRGEWSALTFTRRT